MKLHDGTTLMHKGLPYDPVKAHEYYIRTRKLKGRHKGHTAPNPPPKDSLSVKRSPTFTVKVGKKGKSVRLTAQQLEEQKLYAAKRVSDIKKRLTELVTKLKEMKTEAELKKLGLSKHVKKAPTAADKSKAARKSKQFRQSHKQSLATKAKTKHKKIVSKSKKSDPVSELESIITEVKGRLMAEVAKQRELFAATKNG